MKCIITPREKLMGHWGEITNNADPAATDWSFGKFMLNYFTPVEWNFFSSI